MNEPTPRLKILIVDDELDTVDVIHGMLDGLGHELLHAYDGEQALEVARRSEPELIMLDILLPVQDGWLVCSKLKAVEPSPKIIVFTALPRGESDRFAEFVHADGILHKPILREQLLATIDGVMNGQRVW